MKRRITTPRPVPFHVRLRKKLLQMMQQRRLTVAAIADEAGLSKRVLTRLVKDPTFTASEHEYELLHAWLQLQDLFAEAHRMRQEIFRPVCAQPEPPSPPSLRVIT